MEYRLTAHTFGNGLSPAVATIGLIRTVDDGVESCHEVKEFITRNFNVDGGLVLKPAAEVVVKLMRSLNLRLHQVVLNVSVMEAFHTEDLVKDIHSLDLRQDNLPAQHFLGVFWKQGLMQLPLKCQ